MPSVVGIYNQALSHLGQGKEVQSTTEDSESAAALNRFYEPVRDQVLRSFAWPFATKIVALGLIEEDPNSEWAYSYQEPSDCLMIRRILSGSRNDSRQTRVSMRKVYGSAGPLIYTDVENAELEYTVRVTDAGQFDEDFAEAVAYLLAAKTAARLTGGDPTGLGDKALKMYQYQLSVARANAANEDQPDEVPEAESIRVRA